METSEWSIISHTLVRSAHIHARNTGLITHLLTDIGGVELDDTRVAILVDG
ncbi:hypothetical protein NJ7G_1907 [Natrinema sp. J7-2]|nr:hypothetical protein NJ7G_1907 [Natrinema sp. J7-2]